MLTLSRKRNQKIIIDGGLITVQIIEIKPGQVKVAVNAPADISVHREEIHRKIISALPIEKQAPCYG